MNKFLLALNRFSGIDIEALLARQKLLNEEVESLKKKLAASSEKNEALEIQLTELKNQVRQLDEAIEALKKEVSDKEDALSERNTAYEDLASAHAALNEAKESLEQEKAGLLDRNASLEREKDILTGLKTSLEQEKAELMDRNASLVHDQENLNSQKAALEAERNSLTDRNVDLEAQKNNLTERNTSLEQEKADLMDQKAVLEQEKAALQERNTSLQQDLSVRENALSEKNAAYEALSSEYAALNEAKKSLEQEKAELTDRNASLVQEKKDLNEQKAALEQEKTGLADENASLIQEKKVLTDREAALEAEKTELNDRNASLQQELSDLTAKLERLQEEQKRLMLSLENLKVQQVQKQGELKQEQTEAAHQWQEKENEYKNRLQQQEQQLQSQQDEIGHMQELFRQQEQSAALLHEKISDYEARLAGQQQTLEKQEEELKVSAARCLAQEEQLTVTRSEADALRKELEDVRKRQTETPQPDACAEAEKVEKKTENAESAESSQKLIEAQAEIDALHQKFAQMETERVQLLQQIATLRQQVAELSQGTPQPEATTVRSDRSDSASEEEKRQEPQPAQKENIAQPVMVELGGHWMVRYPQAVSLQTRGLFRGHTLDPEEEESYPYSREPQYHTEVGRWTEQPELPQSFAGKMLKKGLQVLDRLQAGIRLSASAALPVDGTEWGLHPDLLIEWPEHELCVAVLVDAPYDLRTGEPWHGVPSVADDWMNCYYTNRGACVVRVAEEQLTEDYEQVLAYLSNYLYEQTGDHRLMQQVAWGVSTPLWSAEGIQSAVAHHYREQYLGAELCREIQAATGDVIPVEWGQFPFTVEQLPAEWAKMKAFREACRRNYVVVRTRPYGSEVLFRCDEAQCEGLYLAGVDRIRNERIVLPFWQVERISGADDIYRQQMSPERGRMDLEQLQAVVTDAVCQYHPVALQYRAADGSLQQTVLYWLTFAPLREQSVELPYEGLFQDLVTDSVDPESVLGMSALHHRVIRVPLRDIRSIRVIDLFVTERGGIGALVNGIYCAVLYQQASLAELLYDNLPEEIKALPYAKANYAHLCMLKQDYKKAYALYTSVAPDSPMEGNLTWEDMISNDFTELVKNHVEPELFIRMAHDLNRAGWHFE